MRVALYTHHLFMLGNLRRRGIKMSIICWIQVSMCLALWQEVDSGIDNEGTKNVKCGAIEDRKKQPNHSPDARKYTGMEPKK